MEGFNNSVPRNGWLEINAYILFLLKILKMFKVDTGESYML